MKRLICIVLVTLLLASCLTGCGNMSLGLGNFTFEHVHFTDAVEGHCATVEKWYDGETGIEVKTKEYGSMYLSEGEYMLFGSGENCPYCNPKVEG